MINFLRVLAGSFLFGGLSLFLTGCGESGGEDPAGPRSAAAFAGTSITFNPTINFAAGNSLTYLNTDSASSFPIATAAINGTYSYVPNVNFSAGVITLYLDGVTAAQVLEVGPFVRSGPNVTGFTVRSGGRSFPATVTGTLIAFDRTSNPGAGGNEVSASDTPASIQGPQALTFLLSGAGSSLTDGAATTFTIAARALSFGSKTLTNPVFLNGSQREWVFKDGDLWYAATVTANNTLSAINVAGPGGSPFYGSYVRLDANSVTVDSAGKFAPGALFFATLASQVGPITVPEGAALPLPSIPTSGPVRFQVNSAGGLAIGSVLGIPFKSASATSVVYEEVLAGSLGSNTATITKDAVTKRPTGVVVTLIRDQATPAVKKTTVTYNFTPVPTN